MANDHEPLTETELWELERDVARETLQPTDARKILRLIVEVKRLRDESAVIKSSDYIDRMYLSEINGEIHWFFDDGWKWRLGDELNGWKLQGHSRSYASAVFEMAHSAADVYPDSTFTKWLRPN